MHAPGVRCHRCKQVRAEPGDSWCTACSAWEAVGRELGGSWDSSGCRALAADLLVNTARQIRALRSLGAGLARVESTPEPIPRPPSVPAGSRRAGDVGVDLRRARSRSDHRESLPRRRAETPREERRAKREPSEAEDEYTDDVESEEEPPDPAHKPIVPDSKQPPPEPEDPPRTAKESTEHRRAGERRAPTRSGGHSDQRSSRKKDRRSRKGKGRHRAGRKHQRLHRLAQDPLLVVHRKPSAAFWELRTSDTSYNHLGRDILTDGHLHLRERVFH